MCIVFFMIGNDQNPTMIGNNRDEYFDRPTIRGNLHPIEEINDTQDYRYLPLDIEQGGSWICFDRILSTKHNLRFAIVLNYHYWTDHECIELANNYTQTIHQKAYDFNQAKSRGLLVKDFLETFTSAMDLQHYAQDIYIHRYEYRPFNLILCDGQGQAYYISSSSAQSSGPEALSSGCLYGISNGYMNDVWDKVNKGLTLLQPLKTRVIQASPSIYNHQDSSLFTKYFTSSLNNFELPEPLNQCMQQFHSTLAYKEPLIHHSLGISHQLGGIFVRPTVIFPSAKGPDEKYRLISNDEKPPYVFGTRTITLLLHYSSSYLLHHHSQDTTNDLIVPRFCILENEIQYPGSYLQEPRESIHLLTNIK